MAKSNTAGASTAAGQEQKAVKGLETKKFELLVKISELHLELQRTNFELYRQGVSAEIAMCW